MLRSKQVFARNSSKWGDPRAKLLAGEAWQQARPTVLASLNLPGEAGGHLAARAALLHGTYREVAARVPDNAQIVFDDDGRLHFAALEPEPEPASLLDLRAAVNAMLPRVDLPEVLLEVFSWTGADQAYGAFQDAARGRVDLARIERHWEDILRIIGSIHTGAVRAYDVIRMLSRDGRPTPLGDAIAHYGRIAKTLHILRLADEPGYRRQIKVQANLQEGRHALARKIFHGRARQLYQRYQDGMEDQIGALGLVLNALVLFNTRYMDAAVAQLRSDGFEVRDEDLARLSPFVRHHINVLGRYSFQLPDLPGGLRPLRDKTAVDEL